jgi:hypothetical protein
MTNKGFDGNRLSGAQQYSLCGGPIAPFKAPKGKRDRKEVFVSQRLSQKVFDRDFPQKAKGA